VLRSYHALLHPGLQAPNTPEYLYHGNLIAMPARLFLSYARDDDEAFVARLHGALEAAGFKVWFDRDSMRARQLTFHHETREAIIEDTDRLVLVIGPHAVTSEYVIQEWHSLISKPSSASIPSSGWTGSIMPAGR